MLVCVTLSTKFGLDQVIILNDVHTVNKRMLWQHLIRMFIDKMCKMTVKGVKSKSESFFSISLGVLELWRKYLRRADSVLPPPPPPPAWIGLRSNSGKCWDHLRVFAYIESI